MFCALWQRVVAKGHFLIFGKLLDLSMVFCAILPTKIYCAAIIHVLYYQYIIIFSHSDSGIFLMSISDDFSFFILGIGGILVRKKKQLKISIFPRLRQQGFL